MQPSNSNPIHDLALITQQRRISVGNRRLLAFAQLYLAKHFGYAPSSMHVEMASTLEQMVEREVGARCAWAAPRAHAKSTLVTLAYVLWCMCYRREPFIVICSFSEDRAKDMLGHIKDELETNDLLRQDFPHICPVAKGRRFGPYRQNVISIGQRDPIRVMAMGPGKAIRGLRHQQHRPSLIICDDLESQESAESPEQRTKLKAWFSKTLIKLGNNRTNVILLGTIIHYDALLADYVLREQPLWDQRCYKAVINWAHHRDLWKHWEAIMTGRESWSGEKGDAAGRAYFDAHRAEMLAGTQVLWEQSEDYYSLMRQRLSDGIQSFDSEKQNDPIDPTECIFRVETFDYWTSKFKSEADLRASLGDGYYIVGACDPATGKSTSAHDDTAIITLAIKEPSRDGGGNRDGDGIYVLEADLRRLNPTETIEAIIDKHRRWRYRLFGFEVNNFQEMLARSVHAESVRAGCELPIHPMQNTRSKDGRIRMLEPWITRGTLRFNRNDRKLIDQLRQYPKSRHDDGPDALAMAIDTAAESSRRNQGIRWVQLI